VLISQLWVILARDVGFLVGWVKKIIERLFRLYLEAAMSRKTKRSLRPLTEWSMSIDTHQPLRVARIQVSRAKVLLSARQALLILRRRARRAANRVRRSHLCPAQRRRDRRGPVIAGAHLRAIPEEREYICLKHAVNPTEIDGTATWSLTCLQRAVRERLPSIRPIRSGHSARSRDCPGRTVGPGVKPGKHND